MNLHAPSGSCREPSCSKRLRCRSILPLCLAVVLMASTTPTAFAQILQQTGTCESELQTVMCGQISLTQTAEREACCAVYAPVPAEQTSRAQAQTAAAAKAVISLTVQGEVTTRTIDVANVKFTAAMRTDLTRSQRSAKRLNYYMGTCLAEATVQVPYFYRAAGGTAHTVNSFSIPQLPNSVIAAVKNRARRNWPWELRAAYNRIARTNTSSRFIHPAGYAGPAELALLQYRLGVAAQIQQGANKQPPQQEAQPQQQEAAITEASLHSLITGANVKPKVYPGPWWPPVDCPPEGYPGPFPMVKVVARWGGTNGDSGVCHVNYPAKAPQGACAHIAFVELDGQMSYKQALAYWATGDVRHAQTAMKILEGWPAVNKEWGLLNENGPLEAGWGCAAMSRAMDLLKSSRWQGFNRNSYSQFVDWVNRVLMPQMDYYVYDRTPIWIGEGKQNIYGNWHATMADCFVAFGLLTDDRVRYQKGIELFKVTLTDYLRWGKGAYKEGRIIGEASETLRDIYHTEFGFGGLIQVAEAAWQQNEDLYGTGDYALPAALELHARIINAFNRTAQLPQGFKFFADMPAPPAGTVWQFDIREQLWHARNRTTGAIVQTQNDGVKYIVGVTWMSTGWEVAYNHYAGRLGMELPETAKLLRKYWPESHEFHWGLGTLTHADSAQSLWQLGVTRPTVCSASN